MRPCEALLAVGRELHDQPHGEYGAWIAEAYAKALAERRVKVESCRALVHAWPARTIRARYDRVLIPWYRNSVDPFLMCVSIRRGCLVDTRRSVVVLKPKSRSPDGWSTMIVTRRCSICRGTRAHCRTMYMTARGGAMQRT